MEKIYVTKFLVYSETFEMDVKNYYEKYWQYLKENNFAVAYYFIEELVVGSFLVLILHDYYARNRN